MGRPFKGSPLYLLMSIYDQEQMRRTVRIRFSGGPRIFTRGQVIAAIAVLVNTDNIVSIYKIGEHSEWYVIFKTDDVQKNMEREMKEH